MSCNTRVLKILQCDWSESFWAITETQNYSGCNGNYINFYSKYVQKLRKSCFWSLLTQAQIVPQTRAALVFEDYKFLATRKKMENSNVKILRKAANKCTENTYFMRPLCYA